MNLARGNIRTIFPIAALAAVLLAAPLAAAEKHYRITPYGEREFNQGILWGSEATSPDGFNLAFGGQDLDAEDGIGHTRIKEKKEGEWIPLHDQLRKTNPYQASYDKLRKACSQHSQLQARARSIYFSNPPKEDAATQFAAIRKELGSSLEAIKGIGRELMTQVRAEGQHENFAIFQASAAVQLIAEYERRAIRDNTEPSTDLVRTLRNCAHISQAFDCEPAPRALSPIVFEPKSGLFILFGGDHFDYLKNDLWTFDPKKRKWSVRGQEKAPRPRAGHTLKATGDGKIVMSGGYTYTSNTDYCGSQYEKLDDGEWVYDVEKDAWSGEKENEEKMIPSADLVFRAGPFHPEFYFEPAPDRAANEKTLATIGPNTWTKLNPPKLPELNRDWGTAIYDPQRDLILRFSGGHSAHGGSDVLHYHLATNRWELCFPVEFPLGQLYSNTSYPEGFNYNGRPWVTGHTYKSYGLDPRTQKMLFVGHDQHTYFYDPAAGDWEPRREAKPEGMNYGSSFYTLTLWATTDTLYCWTQNGELFKYIDRPEADNEKASAEKPRGWLKVELSGDKLPGSVVDHSGMTWDSKRNRLLCCRNPYGEKHTYDGQIHAIDLKTGEVSALSPAGAKGMAQVRFLREVVYEPAADLMIVGALLPAGSDGQRQTPAYDCANNRWVSLNLTGDHPHGKEGSNVSLGLIYDPKRKLLWAVDTNSQVYTLKLAAEKADLKPVE